MKALGITYATTRHISAHQFLLLLLNLLEECPELS